jgi:sulfonate transport system substrate-binding protein
MKRTLTHRVAGVALTLALWLASAPVWAAEQHLMVTAGGECICHAPLYVGIDKGFFKARGLDIQIRQIPNGFTAMGVLQTGDADIAEGVPAVAAAASIEGIDATAILIANGDASGTVDTSKFFAIVAAPGSGIAAGNLASLRGKKVGVSVGTIGHQYLHYTLAKAGLGPKDVTIQNVAPGDLVSALQSKSVDAIVGWEPAPLIALSRVPGAVIAIRGGGAIQYMFARWATPGFLTKDPVAAKAFVEAYVQSMQYARQHTDETAAIAAKYLQGIDKAVIAKALTYLSFDPRVSKVTLDAARQGIEFSRSLGRPTGNYIFANHLDSALVASALKEHPEYVNDLPPIPDALRLR